MGVVGDAVGDLKDATTLLSVRGLIGGAYLGSLMFAALLGHNSVNAADLRPWVLALSLLFGFVGASIGYEVLLPLFGALTAPVVKMSFRRIVSDTTAAAVPKKYGDIRRFREQYLAGNSSEHRKQRLRKDEQLRQMMTYLCSASIVALALIVWCGQKHPMPPALHGALLLVTVGVATSTFVGQLMRSYSFGRTIGLAFSDDARTNPCNE